MAANLNNVTLPAGEWVDLYAATGLTVGDPIAVENVGSAEVRVAVSASQPATDSDAYNVLRRPSEVLRNTNGDPGAWAMSPNTGGKVAVRSLDTPGGFYPTTNAEIVGPIQATTVNVDRTAILQGPFTRSGAFLAAGPAYVSATIDWFSDPWRDYTQGFFLVSATGAAISLPVRLEGSHDPTFPAAETDVRYEYTQVTGQRRFPFSFYGPRYQRLVIGPPAADLTDLTVSSGVALNLARSTPRFISDNLAYDSHVDFTVAAGVFGELPDGSYRPAVLNESRALVTELDGVTVTPSGAMHTEGVLDYVNLSFDIENGETSILELQAVNSPDPSTGTFAIDTTNGGLVITSSGVAGEHMHVETIRRLPYRDNTGHALFNEITVLVEDATGLTGAAYIEWGLGKYLAGTFDGLGFGVDTTGIYTWLMKADTYIFKDYQPDWNFDEMLGGQFSKFLRDNVPEALSAELFNLFRIEGEFLFAAEQVFKVKRPTGKLLLANAHPFPNKHTFTSLRTADLPVFLHIHQDPTTGGVIKLRSGSLRGSVFSNRTVSAGKNPNGDIVDIPAAGVHSGNTTYTPLVAPNLTWDGTFKKLTEYNGAGAVILSDVDGTAQFIGSSDGVTDEFLFPPVPYDAGDGVASLYTSANVTYGRWTFTAAGTQTQFLFEGKFYESAPGNETAPAGANIGRNVPAVPTHALTKFFNGSTWVAVDATNRLPVAPSAPEVYRTLTSRMLNLEVASGYVFWPDLNDADYLYLLEAPLGSVSSDTGFRGIRIPKDAAGNLLQPIEINTAANLTYDGRAAHGGWTS